MNKLKALVASTVFCAALTTQVAAEQIEIAGQIAPIAALVPIGGNTNLNWNKLIVDGADATTIALADATPVAKFFINTNMPKWNVYMAFANGGRLLNNVGKGADVTAGDGTFPAFDVAGLVFDQFLKAEDDGGLLLAPGVIADYDVTDDGIPLDEATLGNLQSFTSMLNTATYCATAAAPTVAVACALTNNWINGTDVNSFGVDVKVAWNKLDGDGRVKPKLAGTYSEIIYVTLATSY